ncbi:hypothetical protein E2542_SST10873 [Spatholobus suberectus]|nr:hypothetical protein E2542_SST10873 [Spatholobus suberectus]
MKLNLNNNNSTEVSPKLMKQLRKTTARVSGTLVLRTERRRCCVCEGRKKRWRVNGNKSGDRKKVPARIFRRVVAVWSFMRREVGKGKANCGGAHSASPAHCSGFLKIERT